MFFKDLSSHTFFQNNDITTILKIMPKKDQMYLDLFFRELFEKNSFAYVVFGSKPMAFETFSLSINPFTAIWDKANSDMDFQPTTFEKFMFFCDELLSYKRYQRKQAYLTWRKYEHLVPSNRLMFFYKTEHQLGQTHVSVFLINKSLFASTINKHLNDFQRILNRQIDGDTLLKELIISKNLEPIISHDGLFGTLLGFGRDNSFLYYNKSLCETHAEKCQFIKNHHLDLFWNEAENYLPHLPNFIADITSKETESLKKGYLSLMEKISAYYQDKDFLFATLMMLTSNSEPN